MESKNYYVYVHRRGDGRAVYVGKGTGSRAWHFSNRDHALHVRWMRRYVNQGMLGFCEIVDWHMTEGEALEREKELIGYYEDLGDKLFNNHFSRHRGWSNDRHIRVAV